MPDITMCKGVSGQAVCLHRTNCYRYTAQPSEFRQAYFAQLPMADDGSCRHYVARTRAADRARADGGE